MSTESFTRPAPASWFQRRQSIAAPRPTVRLLGFALLALLGLGASTPVLAQVNGDFRSIASGNWNATSTWERHNGTIWQAGFFPTNTSANAVTIRSGHVVTVTAAVTSDQVTIDAGGQVTVNSGQTWTIDDGAGTDLTVNGTLSISGTVSPSAGPQYVVSGVVVNAGAISTSGVGSSFAFNAGSLYQHTQNGGTVPTATWNVSSTCEIVGIVGTVPSGLGQTFGNFAWNSSGHTGALNINGLSSVNGDLTIADTGSGSLSWINANASKTIGGNLNIQGGTFTFAIAATGTRALTVTGDLNLSGGTFDFCTSGGGTPTLNLAGNYNQTGGTFQNTSGTLAVNFTGVDKTFERSAGTLGTANLNFNVNSPAVLTLNNDLSVSASRTLTVASGATLNCGPNLVTGAGAFTLSAGGTLGIGSPAGIASTGASGNIQTATRTFTSGASYLYNGTAAQVTGSGLPTAASAIVNLTITNAAGVTLSGNASVTGTLRLADGAVSYGGNTLTLGNGANIIRETGSLPSAPAFGATVNVTYAGSTAVNSGPELPVTTSILATLTNNNSGGVTLTATPTVNTRLTLNSGKLITGAFQINLASAATVVGGSAGSYVDGAVQKAFSTGSGQSFTFPIGDAANYTPVAMSSINVTAAGSLKASTTGSEHPNVAGSGLNASRSVNRHYTLTNSGTSLAISTAAATFNFVPGDVDSGANTAAFVVRRFSGGAWTATTTGTRTATSTAITGLAGLGDFAIGEQAIDNYLVIATTPQTASAVFTTTVTARDLLNQTVVGDSSTVVTMTGTGSVEFDSNGDGAFGDNTRTLSSGTFAISTRDNIAETITITATDGNGKTGSTNIVINTSTSGGPYRTAGSGNWGAAGTWQRWNGSTWVAAAAAPTTTDGVVTIRNGHSVTNTTSFSSDEVIIEAGGQVTVSSGDTWTIANGPGTDLTVFGTVRNSGAMTMTGTGVFESGGKYQHNLNGGTIITATWDPASTCEVTGATTSQPGGLGQAFGNFTWNPEAQAANNLNLAGGLTNVRGNFTVVNTGTSGSLRLTGNTTATTFIGGNLVVQGGKLVGGNGTGTNTINLAGNLSVTGGTFDLKDATGSSGGGCIINASNNVTVASGATLTGSNGARRINFAKAGTQTFANAGTISGPIDWTVNAGSTVQGSGALNGPLVVNGTLTPGAGLTTLTLNTPPSLAGTCLAELNATNAPTADLLALSAGTLTNAGVLVVTNLGPAPTNGSVFQLFSAPAYAGAFSSLVLPGGPVHWLTGNLTVNGTITFTNRRPVARAFSTTLGQGGVVNIPFNVGKYSLGTDADGDPVVFASAFGAGLGSVGATASTLSYTNTSGAPGAQDTFSFVVSDGFGGLATNTVTITLEPGQGFNQLSVSGNTLTYLGLPGASYALENTAVLNPATWVPVVTNTAAANGLLVFTLDSPSGFYRTRYVSGP